jgi:hypothetical protein
MLVAELGPVDVPGYPLPVSAENLRAALQSYWQAPILSPPGSDGADTWSHRKDFAGDLVAALLQQAMKSAAPEKLLGLARILGTALRQRHLLIYAQDPTVRAFLGEAHWDGAVRNEPGDYLMVVDSNLGFNKVNPNVEQTIDYEVTIDATGTLSAQLTLTYRHRIQRPSPACVHEPRYGDTYDDLMQRCYWDFLRIYVPAGSELLELSGSDAPAEVYDEANRTVIATAFLLEIGQSRTIRVSYRPKLPLQAGQYALLIQKQPGTDAVPFRVRVRLPRGSTDALAQPVPLATLANDMIWQSALEQDWEMRVSWN